MRFQGKEQGELVTGSALSIKAVLPLLHSPKLFPDAEVKFVEKVSKTLDPGFRRGDVKGFTRMMKNVPTRRPPYVNFWVLQIPASLIQKNANITNVKDTTNAAVAQW